MRWMNLFADLETQAAGLLTAEVDAEIAERARIETGRLGLHARLRGAVGHPVSIRCAGAGPCVGQLERIGPDWLLLTEPASGRETLVPLRSLLAAGGLGRHSSAEAEVALRLGLRAALRGIARDREPIRLVLGDGTPIDGTLDRVGADYVEVAEHAPGEPRRPGAVSAVRTVPMDGIGVVRRW